MPISVESVDFGNWIRSRFSRDDHVVVKLDIEGAEYEVLDKMLSDGSIAFVDKIYLELHNVKVGVSQRRDQELLRRLRTHQLLVVEHQPGGGPGNYFGG